MHTQTLTMFLMWCSIINFALLMFSFLMCAFAGDMIYKLHSKWFPMPREAFTIRIYTILGIYKILVIAFNVVPWIALMIL